MSASERIHTHTPSLARVERDGLAFWTDAALLADHGVSVAFSERVGGVSAPPYASLNLGGHVGDEPACVDENRRRLLSALFLDARKLVTGEQVHGDAVEIVGAEDAGRGAFAAGGFPPVPAVDALVTASPGLPVMMMYADCVPVVLVSLGERPAIAVVHAGWRGALGRIAEKAAASLVSHTGADPSSLIAYVGAHIGECCYEVDETLLSHFAHDFVTICEARGRLDLAAAVAESLTDAGVPPSRQCRLGMCTSHHTDAFYSYRAEKRTGRHGAVAAVVKTDR